MDSIARLGKPILALDWPGPPLGAVRMRGLCRRARNTGVKMLHRAPLGKLNEFSKNDGQNIK
jgi:hypothetical protein